MYVRKQFYQTALGNCYGLKLQNADCSLKNKFIVSFIIIIGTLSFPMRHKSSRVNYQPMGSMHKERIIFMNFSAFL